MLGSGAPAAHINNHVRLQLRKVTKLGLRILDISGFLSMNYKISETLNPRKNDQIHYK